MFNQGGAKQAIVRVSGDWSFLVAPNVRANFTGHVGFKPAPARHGCVIMPIVGVVSEHDDASVAQSLQRDTPCFYLHGPPLPADMAKDEVISPAWLMKVCLVGYNKYVRTVPYGHMLRKMLHFVLAHDLFELGACVGKRANGFIYHKILRVINSTMIGLASSLLSMHI